jgi:hypothetical protein
MKFVFLPRNSKYWRIYVALAGLFVLTLVASFVPVSESWAPAGLVAIPVLALVLRMIEAARTNPVDMD